MNTTLTAPCQTSLIPAPLKRSKAGQKPAKSQAVQPEDDSPPQSPSSKEFLAAVEKSIGAPLTTIRVTLRK